MKNFKISLKSCIFWIIILSTFRSYSQKTNTLPSPEDEAFNEYFINQRKEVKITGKILNLKNEDISKIKIDFSILTPFDNFRDNKSCQINPDLSFEFSLEYCFPNQQIWVIINDSHIFGLFVNNNLHIEIDFNQDFKMLETDFNSIIKLKGDDSELNKYINNGYSLFQRETQFIRNSIRSTILGFDLNDNQIIEKVDSLYTILKSNDSIFLMITPQNLHGYFVTILTHFFFLPCAKRE